MKILISLVAISSLVIPPALAQTTPGFNPHEPHPAGEFSRPESIDDVVGLLDSGVATVEGFFDQSIGQLTGVVGQVSGLLGQAGSPLSQLFQDAQALTQLMVRLLNFPSTVSGWWDGMVAGLTGDFDACRQAVEGAATPPFIFESGWCFGGSQSNSPALLGDFELLGRTDPNSPGGQGDSDFIGHSSPPPSGPAAPKSIGEMVSAASGPAGLPVPSLLRYEADRAVDGPAGDGDRFEVVPAVLKYYLGNRAERGVSRLQAESVLGMVGQAKMLEELQGLQQAVAGNFGTAGAAQELSVTQDVMKQMVQMQANETLLTGSLAASSQQLRVDQALTHLNLSNIGRSLDEQNRSRRIDRTLAAYKVLRSTSQVTLF